MKTEKRVGKKKTREKKGKKRLTAGSSILNADGVSLLQRHQAFQPLPNPFRSRKKEARPLHFSSWGAISSHDHPQPIRCAEHQHQQFYGLRGEENDGCQDDHADLAELLQLLVARSCSRLRLSTPPRCRALAAVFFAVRLFLISTASCPFSLVCLLIVVII